MIFFSIYLNPKERVLDLEKSGLVESIDDLQPTVIATSDFRLFGYEGEGFVGHFFGGLGCGFFLFVFQ